MGKVFDSGNVLCQIISKDRSHVSVITWSAYLHRNQERQKIKAHITTNLNHQAYVVDSHNIICVKVEFIIIP